MRINPCSLLSRLLPGRSFTVVGDAQWSLERTDGKLWEGWSVENPRIGTWVSWRPHVGAQPRERKGSRVSHLGASLGPWLPPRSHTRRFHVCLGRWVYLPFIRSKDQILPAFRLCCAAFTVRRSLKIRASNRRRQMRHRSSWLVAECCFACWISDHGQQCSDGPRTDYS